MNRPPVLPQDATASTQGTVYQLYVVVWKCFEMVANQKVIVERFGDVTLSGQQQLEIKYFSDPLTDNHPNFWKSLNNWTRPEFDENQYESLILYTKQVFGSRSLFHDWNRKDVAGRMATLQAIVSAAEEKFKKQSPQAGRSKKREPPDVLLMQRDILQRSGKLHSVVAKLAIADASPDIEGLYSRLKQTYAKGILEGKTDEFMQGLLGHVISPPTICGPSWEITFDDFTTKVRELTSQYCRGTCYFPMKFKRENVSPDDQAKHSTDLFVSKIRDIQYETVIPKAIADYLYASDTILKDFKDYQVPHTAYRDFLDSVMDQFIPAYRKACRGQCDISNSQNFYDDMMSSPVPSFQGFQPPGTTFRNGVLHMQLNDVGENLRWRLIRS